MTFGLTAGAFVVGRVTVDPTATDEYQAQSTKLKSAQTELTTVEQQLATSSDEIETLKGDLSEAEAQVDALTADLPAGESPNEPALSDGVAIAPRNVKIAVKTRSQQCFGSAGCNVTVQVDPDYVGNQDVSTGSWEITYEIRGGEDGPIIETMTLTDGTFTFPEEQSLSTTSSGTKLKAVVTDVAALD
jgi:hypothetical protein